MKKVFGIAAFAAAALAFASCSSDNSSLTGEWKSAAPVNVTETVADASTVSQVISVDFKAGDEKTTGPLEWTSEYSMTAPADSAGNVASYKVIAKISGTWTRDAKDDDEYTLSFDQNTLNVSGVDAPELGPGTDLFLGSLGKFSKIEDVKVSKDGKTMSFETDKPDVTYNFVRK